MIRKNALHFVVAVLLLNSCAIADLSQDQRMETAASEQRAQELLQRVVKAQGFEYLGAANVYSMELTDHWPGMMGKMMGLWPEPDTRIHCRFNYDTFDGRLTFVGGPSDGVQAGIQNWHYYEQAAAQSPTMEVEPSSAQEKYVFGLAVIHYFVELPYRLSHAPILRYYGSTEVRDQTYECVFASWEQEGAHPDYDQYILYINTETDLVDYCVYTLRDNKNPITRSKYGSIAYQEYRDVDGFLAPFSMPVMLDDGILSGDLQADYFHRFEVHAFTLGGFEEEVLYPLAGIEKVIDGK